MSWGRGSSAVEKRDMALALLKLKAALNTCTKPTQHWAGQHSVTEEGEGAYEATLLYKQLMFVG